MALKVGIRSRKRRNRRRAPKFGLTQAGKDYVQCTLNPMSGIVAKIPDGACESVVVKLRQSFNVTPANLSTTARTTATVLFTPGLPCSAYVLDGGFTGENNRGSTAVFNIDQVAGVAGMLVPFREFIFSPNSAVVTGSQAIANKMLVTKARCVSLHIEVTPNAPILQQGGTTVFGKHPFHSMFDPHVQWLGSALSPPQAFYGVGGTLIAGGGSSGAIVTSFDLAAVNFGDVAAYPDARVAPATENTVAMLVPECQDFVAVLPQNNDEKNGLNVDNYPWTPQLFTGSYQAGDFTQGAYAGNQLLQAASGNYSSDLLPLGNFWQPPESECLIWSATSLPVTASFTFTVTSCMELCVRPKSDVALFSTPPAMVDETAIKLVRDAMRELPVSVPAPEATVSWWDHIVKAATGVARVVAPMLSNAGIPVVSPIASIVESLLS